MFHKLTEEQEIAIERDRAKAKAGWRHIKRVLKWIGLALLLSFAYTTGEHAGVEICAPAISPRR